MPSQRQNQIRKAVWLLSVCLTVALCFAGLTSNKWVSGKGKGTAGLTAKCSDGGGCSSIPIGSLTWAWQFTLVTCGFAVGFMFITIISICISFKFNRDRVLFTGKVSCGLANFLLFLSMIIWPIGLEDDELVPCNKDSQGNQLPSEAYHMCDPWDLDTGIYLMIVAMIFMTFAMCLSSLVTSKVSQRDTDRLKRKRRDTQGWYDPSRPRPAKPSGEQSATGSSATGGAAGAAGAARPSKEQPKLKPVREEEPEEAVDIGYLMIEGQGLQGWGEQPQTLQGGSRVTQNEVYEDQSKASYFNPYFNDDEEFM
jgi:hypothetical protein